ncbi:hypothetical protein B0H17DRAFT_359292 [Mycena rosella]|uniref:Stealth protein CR3 conserved region 3 domain-containing protein n=1 Tax=Mycena rosella TaxID=1033263 RepID=A0AAD7G4U6_MYCRO|nr:hypothetical protein B0H17DRAFT_359292 [Mycena rosella]
MALLPLRARRSYHAYTDRFSGRGSLFRCLIPPLAVSRTVTLLFFTFALSLGSIVLILARYTPRSTQNISFQLDHTRPIYDPFVRPPAANAVADATIRPIKAHLQIPDACLDQWVSFGRWRGSCIRVLVEESAIDLVYIWVNGSDMLHSESREDLLGSLNYTTRNARFRQHDELRYSLRSAFKNTKTWKHSVWHIVTADVPDPDKFDGSERLGLVPQWLDLESAWAGGESGEPPVHLYHDSDIFHLTSLPGRTPTIEEVDKWRNSVLPTFNSMAVESQLPHLDPNIVSENLVYLNDDQFFVLPLPPSAFHSVLYGPVIRLYLSLMIQADVSGQAYGGGEWRSLGWSAHILNQRFGTRGRAYVGHNARSFSLPLMHEAALAFGESFAMTPLSQFRGSHAVGGEFEVNTIFMATHFVMERHREALLWSWVVAKWGGVANGILDEELKDAMWLELGAEGDHDELRRNTTTRTSNDDVLLNMRAAGLGQPQSDRPEKRANTTYLFVSLDGYTPNYERRPQEVGLGRDECIGSSKEAAWTVFRRLAVEKTHCGDAVIAALTDASPHGLSIFLPPYTSSAPVPVPAVLPLIMPSSPPSLPDNPRGFAVRLIHRYAYAIADTPAAFFGVETAEQGRVYFSWLHADTALLCVNDDLYDDPVNVTQGDAMLREWFQRKWPEKLAYEN